MAGTGPIPMMSGRTPATAMVIDEEKLNPHGGAIALGHPLGCSGARLIATLINDLQTADKRLGIATLCVGGGQGVATIIERMS